jgi:SWI/SNF-related matrix-associated actin-dependent regulator 1 of chromatin subfamily A
MATVIRIDPCGPGRVVCRPAEYLGGDGFARYRAVTAGAGATYDRGARGQAAPVEALPALVAALTGAGYVPQVSPALAADLESGALAAEAHEAATARRISAAQDTLRARGLALFRHQVEGIRWLAGRASAILADDMGLGKTCQALLALADRAPAIVVCPAVAKGVWRAEATKWRPDLAVSVLAGRRSFRWPAPGEVVVLNYDILPPAVPEGPPAGLTVIADEAHACKNSKAKRTERMRALVRVALANAGRAYQLTGTPLLNRPMELYTLISTGGPALLRESFGSWNGFVAMFRGRREQVARNVYTWQFDGPRPGDPEVAEALARVMLRRRKEDVLDLPERIVQRIEVNDIDKSVYALCDSVMGAIEARGMELEEVVTRATCGGMPGFEDISRMRAACASAKIPHALALVEEYEEAGEPVVVASAHRAPVDVIGARPGWAAITGDTSADERTRIEAAFQAGELRGIAMTIRAGGVAITLTRASRMILVDLEWTPGINSQAEDRIHRIGQGRSCLYQHLVLAHPLEARIWGLLQEKRDMVAHTVEAAADLHRDHGAGGQTAAQALRGALQAAREAQRHAAPPQDPDAPQGPRKGRRGPATEEEQRGIEVLRLIILGQVPASLQYVAFARSLLAQYDSRGGLSDRQWACVADAHRRHASRVAGLEGGAAAGAPVPADATPRHRWIADAVAQLTDLDPDGAQQRNGAGWNKVDGGPGRHYAHKIRAGSMTAADWADAERRVSRYVRTQISPLLQGSEAEPG